MKQTASGGLDRILRKTSSMKEILEQDAQGGGKFAALEVCKEISGCGALGHGLKTIMALD